MSTTSRSRPALRSRATLACSEDEKSSRIGARRTPASLQSQAPDVTGAAEQIVHRQLRRGRLTLVVTLTLIDGVESPLANLKVGENGTALQLRLSLDQKTVQQVQARQVQPR